LKSVRRGNGPFNGISVARGVTNTRPALSNRSAKGWLSVSNFVILQARKAYAYEGIVLRLPYGGSHENQPSGTSFQDPGHGGRPTIAKRKAQIVTAILRDLDNLGEGAAFKVPLADLGDTKENVRSALNRATRKSSRVVATATDENFLYVWNVTKPKGSNGTRPNGQGKSSQA
jgi:hypothetical protein